MADPNQAAVDLIICTRDRCNDLSATLDALQRPAVTQGVDVRLTVIDNGSTDQTKQIVEQKPWPHLPPRYHYHDEGGLASARNAGLSVTDRRWVVFIDDDVRPEDGWLSAMIQPLVEGRYDAVVGTIKPAEHLRRKWMGKAVACALALNDQDPQPNTTTLVGANMAFDRQVLKHVPGFNPALDPGALGFAGDTLFSLQLGEAGLALGRALDAVVIHHFSEDRLLRRSILNSTKGFARSRRYINRHYGLWQDDWQAFKTIAILIKLGLYYLAHPLVFTQREGCSNREFKLRNRLAYYLTGLTPGPGSQKTGRA